MKRLLLTGAILLSLSGCAATQTYDFGYRTQGMTVEDSTIERWISNELKKRDARLGDANISVDSYNGTVLITGQVPSLELSNLALDIARNARMARVIHNELTVSANATASEKAFDAWIKTKISAALTANKIQNPEAIDPARLDIVVRNKKVYLMGMVTRSEAESVVASVSTIHGIIEILKAFEYLD